MAYKNASKPSIYIFTLNHSGFIHLLRAHHQGFLPVNEVVVKVAHLFAGHFDLQEEFVSFLPVDAQLQVIYLLFMYENKSSWASEELIARYPQLILSNMGINFLSVGVANFQEGSWLGRTHSSRSK